MTKQKTICNCIIYLIVAFAIANFKWSSADQRKLTLITFNEDFRNLSKRFTAQSDHTIWSLRLALRRMFETPEPRGPSSVIVLIPPTLAKSSFPMCYLKAHGQLMNDRFKRRYYKALSVKMMDSDYIQSANRSALHKELNNYFHNGGAVVVVSGIEEVRHYENLTLFRMFSDTTHAPVKKAVFFFLVKIPNELYKDVRVMEEKDAERKLSSLGDQFLENVWNLSDARPDGNTYALLTRIGSWGTIMLNDGDTCQE